MRGGDDDQPSEIERDFGEAVGRSGPVVLRALASLEHAFRRLHPPDFEALAGRLVPIREAIDEAIRVVDEAPTPQTLAPFRGDLLEAARLARSALGALIEPGPEGPLAALRAMHEHARAQAVLYPLRRVLPPVSAFFAEPFRHDALSALEVADGVEQEVGLFRGGGPGGDAQGTSREGFDLYVPESYTGGEDWPLVVALHGGSGNGADFLWTWLREARSRRCLLLAPSSRGSTWSLSAPDQDGRTLRRLTEWVATRWRVDSDRVLLTGLSDGATMSLLVGLSEDSPFTHLAPISGVLHPLHFAIGNLDRASDVPIYLVHGALDWMFPVALAREAAKVLEDAGAALVYRELADLSHTYPREENARIIEWLDPRRAVPGDAAAVSRSARIES